ncbi:hypothetical protein [Streptomyces sp. NPDC051219]|uniref:hypothetical protein n=1 Tax=Streptomyces sp. NPDC051219 TaxID=3155283 RepID=UPI003419E78B
MSRTSPTQRLVMLTASSALVAGGALLPSSAFAAPVTPAGHHVSAITADRILPLDPGTPDPVREALERAITKTDAFGSAEVGITTETATERPVAMEGTYSWGDGQAMDMEMDAEAAGMQDLVSDGTVRCLLVDKAYHYEVDPQPDGPLKGKHWMKIDASAVFGEKGASALSGSGMDDLRIIGLSDDVKNVGKETVLGKETTHYKGVISKDDLGAAKDLLAPEDKNSLMHEFTGGVEETTVEVWLDDNDLPVRIKQQLGSATFTTDFEKFGATKPIEAPPAADTADMTDEVKAATSGSGPQI